MSDIVKLQNAGLVNLKPKKNFLEEYGDEASSRSNIVGSLLKYSKGDYLLGQNSEMVPLGTRYVAHMDEFYAGWTKWHDGKPVDEIMVPISKGERPPKRGDLGDLQEDQWELDDKGKPRDPWVQSNWLLLKPVGQPYSLDNAITFATSSQGGIRALGLFVKAVGVLMARHVDENDTWTEHPVMELGSDRYEHSNKAYGWIKFPVFKLVDWESADLFDLDAAALAEAGAETKTVTARKPSKTR